MILHCITPITLSNFWLKACDITIKSFYYLLSMDISSQFHIYSLSIFLQISFWYNISFYMNMPVFIMKFLHSKLFTYNITCFIKYIRWICFHKRWRNDLISFVWMNKSCDEWFFVTIDTCELWYTYILDVGTFQIHC